MMLSLTLLWGSSQTGPIQDGVNIALIFCGLLYLLQTPEALATIKALISWIPAIGSAAGIAIMLGYPLTDKKCRTIVRNCRKRDKKYLQKKYFDINLTDYSLFQGILAGKNRDKRLCIKQVEK